MSWNNSTPWEVILWEINHHAARLSCAFPEELNAGDLHDTFSIG